MLFLVFKFSKLAEAFFEVKVSFVRSLVLILASRMSLRTRAERSISATFFFSWSVRGPHRFLSEAIVEAITPLFFEVILLTPVHTIFKGGNVI